MKEKENRKFCEKPNKDLINIIKSVTLFAKKLPFYYAGVYVLALSAYLIFGAGVSTFFDMTFVISPFVALMSLRLSFIFKFCKWHRMECILPVIPYAVNLVDLAHPLNSYGAIANLVCLLVLFFLSIVNAYFVFRRAR